MVVADDGCRLWTSVGGAGPAVVLCHGGPGLWDMFGGLAAALPGRVTRWDQRGCGRSAGDGPWTLARAVADLDAVVGAGTAALVGHSWGAQLALAYAVEHPAKVDRLVYMSGTGLSRDAWRPEFHAAYVRRLGRDAARLRELGDREAAMLRWRVDVHDPARADAVVEEMATPWFPVNTAANEGLQDDLRTSWDRVARLVPTLTVPVLILEGAQDVRPRWAVDPLEAALPDVRRVSLPGVGHLPWLEAPDAVLPVLRDFLEPGR